MQPSRTSLVNKFDAPKRSALALLAGMQSWTGPTAGTIFALACWICGEVCQLMRFLGVLGERPRAHSTSRPKLIIHSAGKWRSSEQGCCHSHGLYLSVSSLLRLRSRPGIHASATGGIELLDEDDGKGEVQGFPMENWHFALAPPSHLI
ncbi:hypothetical protein N431DRAFT_242733 [Stipitochalara longipes BDJ]|nr:hypothetical protein N431DRAFT_242733 [Stipitochalara longipes BDJ]